MWLVLPGTVLATVFGYILYWISSWTKKRTRYCNNSLDINNQAIELKDEKGAFKSALLPELDAPLERALPELTTVYELFMRGLEVSNNGNCIGYRTGKKTPYQFMRYTDVYRHSRYFGSALVRKLGLKPGNDTFIGIYAKNCPEWFITLMASIEQSMVIAPLYDTLDANAASYIINQTEMKVVVVDSSDKVQKLLSNKSCPSLQHIIVVEQCSLEELRAIDPDVQIHLFKDLLREGQGELVPMTLPTPEDKYIICYTSGTTGPPKGVVLTHRNLVSAISTFYVLLDKSFPEFMKTRALFISYLPLSHMMEQLCHWCCFTMGGAEGYYGGTIQGLMDDLQELKPTVFPVVPRLLNRFYDLVHANLQKASPLSKAIFNYAYKRKLELYKRGIFCNDTIWDKLVFSKIQKQMGGNVHLMATGSAPISAEVLETCRIVLGSTIFEAYGQTETTAIATLTWLNDWTAGHCGGPAACSIIKLADVAEMNYFASEGKGEIMVKGPNVTQGYYKDPEKTAELFDKDGYLHTGDVGQILPGGRIKIIDRKKHIFKLAQGEYVAPEKIENVYVRAPAVQQVFVDGDSLESYLVAVVVPEESVVKEWYEANVEKNGKSYKEILNTEQVQKFVLSQMQQVGKENKLNSIEQVKAVYLTSEAFTVENGLLTPTLKTKRPQLRKYYADAMQELYNKTRK